MCAYVNILIIILGITEFMNGLDGQPLIENSLKTFRDANETALCRYRNVATLFPPDVWLLRTSGECYNYLPPEKFVNKSAVYYCAEQNFGVPCIYIGDEIVRFNHTDAAIVELLRPLFKSDFFFNQWIECSEAAVECCDLMIALETTVFPTDEYPCPALWDGWSCIPQAEAGSTVYVTCPSYAYTSEEIVCEMEAEKYCFPNGTWNQQTNYSFCASAPVYRRRHNYHVTILAVSIALTIPALIIYLSFRKLRQFRIALHRNLLASIIIKNIFAIMTKKIIILDSLKPTDETNNVMNDNGVACQILAYSENLSKNVVFTSMLILAYFLHKSIARIFAGNGESTVNLYFIYLGVVGVSVIPSTIWAILMATTNNNYCWMVDGGTGYQWITDGYKYGILALNTLLLADIIRVFASRGAKWSKMDVKKLKSALKATLFLIPLFGVPLLFTSQRSLFDTDTCYAGDIYFYVTYAVEAAQGVVVAILFCYWNREVHSEFKRVHRRFGIYIEERYNMRIMRPREVNRRQTASTNVRTSTFVPAKSSEAIPNIANKWESFS